MKEVILVAESGADISPELAREYGIYIVPMHVTFDDRTMNDPDVNPQEIVDYFNQTGEVPKTSGSNIDDFNRVFDEIHEKHPDAHILYLAYSAATTVSFSCGVLASEDRDYVTAIDTKLVTGGQCALVIRVAKLIRENPDWSIDRIVEETQKLIRQTHVCFMPQKLDFLRAGGRCTNAKALIGNILRIVPLIDIKDGLLVATKSYRGRFSRVIEKMVTEYTEQYRLARDILYIMMTPGFEPPMRAVVQETAERLHFKKLEWLKTGSVITSHGGTGAFGIAGFEEGARKPETE
jgi:DegV family protein with EDD domain